MKHNNNMYQLGAIQVDTNEYVLPYKAEKNKKYKCISCQQKLILKKGNIRKCHFSHYSESGCSYYEHPSESELHKDAKYKFSSWLKKKQSINLSWNCSKFCYYGKPCGNNDDEMVHTIGYEENDEVVIEYRDVNNKYIADVAVINNNEVRYIFEIKYTHSTTTNRPEPWFEINAKEILEEENNIDDSIYLTCIRNDIPRYCNDCKILDSEWVHNLPRLSNKSGCENRWLQEIPCIQCGRYKYNPIFVKGYRQICKICLARDTDKLKEKYDITGKCLLKI